MDNAYFFTAIGSIGLIGMADVFIMIGIAHAWFRGKYIKEFFPEWKGTHKLIGWYVLWMALLSLNCVLICMPLIFVSDVFVAVSYIISFSYYYVLGFIYLIVKHSIRYYYDKKKRRLDEVRMTEKQERQEAEQAEQDTDVSEDESSS